MLEKNKDETKIYIQVFFKHCLILGTYSIEWGNHIPEVERFGWELNSSSFHNHWFFFSFKFLFLS